MCNNKEKKEKVWGKKKREERHDTFWNIKRSLDCSWDWATAMKQEGHHLCFFSFTLSASVSGSFCLCVCVSVCLEPQGWWGGCCRWLLKRLTGRERERVKLIPTLTAETSEVIGHDPGNAKVKLPIHVSCALVWPAGRATACQMDGHHSTLAVKFSSESLHKSSILSKHFVWEKMNEISLSNEITWSQVEFQNRFKCYKMHIFTRQILIWTQTYDTVYTTV